MTHNDTYCPKYKAEVLPDEKGNCSLCGASLVPTTDTGEFTREEAEKYLIERDITDIAQMIANSDYTYLNDILQEGFMGYANYTKEQLRTELQDCITDVTIKIL